MVLYYQELGFFPDADPSDVIQRYAEAHGEPPNPADPWHDVSLLASSPQGVWADDPECDVSMGNKGYTRVLPLWARISRGAFVPSHIREQWESETGPIRVTFRLDARTVSVAPRYRNDRLDLEVLRQINRLIAATGRQFECASDRNFALVLCLTGEQKRRLQVERGFPFAW
jgi:hypothetical protein